MIIETIATRARQDSKPDVELLGSHQAQAVSIPASADPTIVKLIPMKDAVTLGIKLRGLELGAVLDFLRDYRMKRKHEEHQVF